MKTVSGNPIVISDAKEGPVEELKVLSFTPRQSFNGYSQPWAPAAGRNKWPFGNVNTGQGTPVAFTYPIPAGTYFLSCVTSGSWMVRFYYQGGGNILTTPGTAITFTDTVVSATWNSATVTKIQLEPGSTATEFEPYSNVCPIFKYTEITVNRSGENYFASRVGTRTSYGITATATGYGIVLTGTATQDAFIDFMALVPPGRYYFSGAPAEAHGEVITSMYDLGTSQRAMQWDGTTRCVYDNGTSKNNQFLSVEGSQYVYAIRVHGGFTCNNLLVYPMIRLPEEDQIVSVELTDGGDVYGGTLDLTTGVLTVKSRIAKFSLFGAGSYTSIDTKYINTIGMIKAWVYGKVGASVPYRDISKGYCNILKCDFIEGGHPLTNSDALWSQGAPNTIGNTAAYPYSLFYYIPYGGPNGVQEATTAAVKQWFVDNDAEIVYDLETPVTYQLTSAQLTLLERKNTITTESGSITITYDEIDRFLEYDSEFIYLLSCLAGEEEFEEEFTLSELSARATDILYAYIIEDEPPIYYDPLESRFEKLLRVKCGFKNKTDYDDEFWSSNFSRAETLLYLSINGETPEDTWEARSNVEQLLYEWLFS